MEASPPGAYRQVRGRRGTFRVPARQLTPSAFTEACRRVIEPGNVRPVSTSSDNASPVPARGPVQVVVATTVFLSFISFWRAAAIVLGDLGSSAFYAGGIAEQAVGKAAPWFILGVMLFSYAVRAIYIESSVMFVRGGVYRVVKEAMGGTLAKLSVSALLFDYVLTGPDQRRVGRASTSSGLVNDVLARYGLALTAAAQTRPRRSSPSSIIVYFWWRNTQGLHESSQRRAAHHAGHDRHGRHPARLVRA